MNKSQLARKRAEVIMKVNLGLMTAAQAARELDVSRKTYYKWEKKGLLALLSSVTDLKAGRPEKKKDTKQTLLEKKLQQTEKENDLLRHKLILKDLLSQITPRSGMDRAKKK